MIVRSTSNRVIAKKPSVTRRSWTMATMVDTPNCHSKRKMANRPMPSTASTTASTPCLMSSPETLPDTVS